jgi:hypothetical protein
MFATPLAVADEVKYQKNKDNKRAIGDAQSEAAKTIAKNSDGDEVSKTASVAQVNKGNKNQTLSSLRVPLENSVGASLGGTQALGLNLGG